MSRVPSQGWPSVAELPPAYVAENTSGPLVATAIAFMVIETTAMTLLYLSRFMAGEQKANWHMITLMTGSYIVALGKLSIALLAVHIGGAGRHTVTLDPATGTRAMQFSFAFQLVCPTTANLSKMSILCLMYNIFGRTSARYRLAIRVTFALCATILLINIVIPFANCKPISANWTFGQQETKCAIDGLALYKYMPLPSVITTVIMVLMPIPALYKLKVSTGTKVGLGVVLSVCLCGLVAAIMRFKSFMDVESFQDITYDQVKPLCWTIAETGLYMVAGVLPTLRPLARKVFGGVTFEKLLSGRSKSNKSGQSDASQGNRRAGAAQEGDRIALVKKEKGFSVLSTESTVVGFEDDDKDKV